MASSGTKDADEARSSPAAAPDDDIERGWTDPPTQATEAPTETKAGPAEPAAPAPAEAPEPSKAAQPPADASPAVEASPPEALPSSAPSPEVVVEPSVEPPPPESANEPSPAVQAAPAVETLPPDALWQAAPPPAKPPPLPAAASSAVEVTESLGRPGLLASLWGAPPTKGWFFVGGVGMIIALFVGIAIGRGLDRPAERVAAPSAPPPRAALPSAPPPPAPAKAAPPVETTSPQPPEPKGSGSAVKHAPGPFNAQAAKLAIDKIVPKLKGCKQPGEPPGTATVTVTFAPTGRVSNAAVTTQRYAGTRTGTCIAARLREARVPEFTGKPVTVKRGIAVR